MGTQNKPTQTPHWLSNDTGELHPNLLEVIKATISNFKHYHIVTLNWSYSKEGF